MPAGAAWPGTSLAIQAAKCSDPKTNNPKWLFLLIRRGGCLSVGVLTITALILFGSILGAPDFLKLPNLSTKPYQNRLFGVTGRALNLQPS